jgi:hypothetical protein
MRIALTIRRYLIVLTAAVFSRSTEDSARESYRARQDERLNRPGRQRHNPLSTMRRRVLWATRRLIRLTTPSFAQEA